jgi:hypothetical protein
METFYQLLKDILSELKCNKKTTQGNVLVKKTLYAHFNVWRRIVLGQKQVLWSNVAEMKY